MAFGAEERRGLRALQGIGPVVQTRLEQFGCDSLGRLARAIAVDLVAAASRLTGSTCRKNNPQVSAAIETATAFAPARVT